MGLSRDELIAAVSDLNKIINDLDQFRKDYFNSIDIEKAHSHLTKSYVELKRDLDRVNKIPKYSTTSIVANGKNNIY